MKEGVSVMLKKFTLSAVCDIKLSHCWSWVPGSTNRRVTDYVFCTKVQMKFWSILPAPALFRLFSNTGTDIENSLVI